MPCIILKVYPISSQPILPPVPNVSAAAVNLSVHFVQYCFRGKVSKPTLHINLPYISTTADEVSCNSLLSSRASVSNSVNPLHQYLLFG